ncbi:MAG: glycosyltransferase family 2 protein [Planctomycetaceae bacterium]|nr:glycosyltransferase family 2 protein [Planctomycetaceae bacterium]
MSQSRLPESKSASSSANQADSRSSQLQPNDRQSAITAGPLFLTAIPVFNEVGHVDDVLDAVKQHSPYILVVDDGSTDGTRDKLARRLDACPASETLATGIRVLNHSVNRGYGGALASAFEYAIAQQFQWLVTIDCDGQHQPQLIGQFVETAVQSDVDIVSGSRYLKKFAGDSDAPEQRREVNRRVTAALNRQLGFTLTDSFCGFKAYRVSSLQKLTITEFGYGMPLELWVQAACHGFKIVELAVPRVYTQETRSFGEALDDMQRRLDYYQRVINVSLAALPCPCDAGPVPAIVI